MVKSVTEVLDSLRKIEESKPQSGNRFGPSPIDYARAIGMENVRVPGEQERWNLDSAFNKQMKTISGNEDDKTYFIEVFQDVLDSFMSNPQWQKAALDEQGKEDVKARESKKSESSNLGFFARILKIFKSIFGIKQDSDAFSPALVEDWVKPNRDSAIASPEKAISAQRPEQSGVKTAREIVGILKPATTPEVQAAKPKKGVKWEEDVVENDVLTKESTAKKVKQGVGFNVATAEEAVDINDKRKFQSVARTGRESLFIKEDDVLKDERGKATGEGEGMHGRGGEAFAVARANRLAMECGTGSREQRDESMELAIAQAKGVGRALKEARATESSKPVPTSQARVTTSEGRA